MTTINAALPLHTTTSPGDLDAGATKNTALKGTIRRGLMKLAATTLAGTVGSKVAEYMMPSGGTTTDLRAAPFGGSFVGRGLQSSSLDSNSQALNETIAAWGADNPNTLRALDKATGNQLLGSAELNTGDCAHNEDNALMTFVESSAGSFIICENPDADSNQASILFQPKDLPIEAAIQLATVSDDRLQEPQHVKVRTANLCHEVLSKSGKACFDDVAAVIASNIVPQINPNTTDETIADLIAKTFSPERQVYKGQPTKCYDTGVATFTGIKPEVSVAALHIRSGEVAECKRHFGENRYYNTAAWIFPMVFGTVSLAVATTATMMGCFIGSNQWATKLD